MIFFFMFSQSNSLIQFVLLIVYLYGTDFFDASVGRSLHEVIEETPPFVLSTKRK